MLRFARRLFGRSGADQPAQVQRLQSGSEAELFTMIGGAMAPTINPNAQSMESTEKVGTNTTNTCVRVQHTPSLFFFFFFFAWQTDSARAGFHGVQILVKRLVAAKDSVAVGDVVAVSNADAVIIRRIAAMPGDALVSASTGERYVLQPAECWVVCDAANRGLALDSREIGPVPLARILGRAIWRVNADAPIGNSAQAHAVDAADLQGLSSR